MVVLENKFDEVCGDLKTKIQNAIEDVIAEHGKYVNTEIPNTYGGLPKYQTDIDLDNAIDELCEMVYYRYIK